MDLTVPIARLASGCRPGSTGWDWLPTGLLRKGSEMCPLHRFPLSQALLDATPMRQGDMCARRMAPMKDNKRKAKAANGLVGRAFIDGCFDMTHLAVPQTRGVECTAREGRLGRGRGSLALGFY